MKNRGLQPHIVPLYKKKKQYSFHRTFGAAALTGLPDSYGPISSDAYQGGTVFCTDYTTAGICSDEDGVPYSPEYNLSKQTLILNVNPTTFAGATLESAIKVPITFGLLPQDQAPLTWIKDGQTVVADSKNWPANLDQVAVQNKRPYYFFVDGPYDAFDNFRSAIWLKKLSVGAGMPWYNEYNSVGPDGILPNGVNQESWHAVNICGWQTINGIPYITCKPWAGSNYGKNGVVFFSRGEFNRNMSLQGTVAITLAKALPTDIKTIQMSLWERLLAWFQIQLGFFSPQH